MFSANTTQVNNDVNYIEDVFSTYLYTGNGTTLAINNGIDLSTKGGLVWIKNRLAAEPHQLFDTARGLYKNLNTNTTSQQFDQNPNGVSAFNSNGFSVTGTSPSWNQSNSTQASWTFRKQPKFFDIVTYTGTGSNRTIAHNLGSVPGCIMVKRTNTTGDWQVYHRSLANTQYIVLNTNAAALTGATRWNSTTPTSTVFSLGTDATVNANGATYVAYIFAHNAGGFGLAGTDNVISCGSYTGNGTGGDTGGTIVTLGYEPQFVLVKNTSSANTSSWVMMDSMRGMQYGNDAFLCPNLAMAEDSLSNQITPLATGFQLASSSGDVNNLNKNFIYIAIRRGPMKVPTSGTSVFAPITGTTDANFGFPADFVIFKNRAGTSGQPFFTRLLDYKYLNSSNTFAEGGSSGDAVWNASQTTFSQALTGASSIFEGFRRAPSFFDVVCYTGTGSARTVTHNLGVAPELIIVKSRSSGTLDWLVYSAPTGNANALLLNTTDSSFGSTSWGSTTPTASVFSTGATGGTNNSGATFVAYLFATCAGVSKVGSYTGTGTTLQVNCGFTGGARFVLIKRTDSTGDWYVWDSARGIVSGNDPYLLLNSTAAEVTSTDYVDTYSAGFEISSTAPAAINASGGSFIFFAVA